MPALTLQTSGLCDRILGPTASWAAPARQPSRLDFLRPTFRAVETLESRHVFSAPAEPAALLPLDDVLAIVDAPPALVMDDPAWQSASIHVLLLNGWRPDRSGTYLVKAYVDPENTWHEANETNNMVVFKMNVIESNKKGD